MQFWYNQQLRRYRSQFIRIFNSFYVEFGADSVAGSTLRKVPCRYGDPSRISESIVSNNSENKMLTAPFITAYISDFTTADDRRQNPTHVETVLVNEREYNEETLHYENTKGQQYSVERYMPIPFDLTFEVDIWTTNLDQKEQLLEQILVLFNPSLDIQTSNNPIDWSVLTVVTLESINYDSRSVPIGTDNPISITTLTFKVPIWLNPPSKVLKQNIINEIVREIYSTTIYENNNAIEWNSAEFLIRQFFIPDNYNIELTFVNPGLYYIALSPNLENDSNAWNDLFLAYNGILKTYANYQNGASQLKLNVTGNSQVTTNNVTGWIDVHVEDQTLIEWHVDTSTLPQTTLNSINAIINPQQVGPGIGSLPAASIGQRYLLVEDMADTSLAWGTITAYANDIIEYTDKGWVVSFNSNANTSGTQYVSNLFSGKMYYFENGSWNDIFSKTYIPGLWSISL